MSITLLKPFLVKNAFSSASSIVARRFYAHDIKEHFEQIEQAEQVEEGQPILETQTSNTPKDLSKIITSNVIEETNLHPALKRAFIKNVGETLTPVQEQCINEFVTSKNGIVVRAKTGTGKTFAFGIPVIHSVLSLKDQNAKYASQFVNSVIFSPTRDLAYQTRQSLTELYQECLPKREQPRTQSRKNQSRQGHTFNRRNSRDQPEELIPLVIGQTPYKTTMNYFYNQERPPIVVATPGRFMDMLANEPKFRGAFKHLQNIIIDEADELLNGNFKEDINKIIDELASIREPIPGVEDANADVKPKTMLFSATVNDDVFNLAERAISNDFPFVDVTGTKALEVNENIAQTLVQTDGLMSSYTAAVKFILDNATEKSFKPIIFLSTTSSVDFVSKLLNDVLSAHNVRRRVLAFHGKLTQGKRDASQRIFREKDNTILVASGIGARGMDFPNVSHVIQIGVSSEIDSHTHKIGRTGRAGKQGDALLFTSKLEEPFVKALMKNGNKFVETVVFDPREPESQEVTELIKEQTKSYLDLQDTFFKTLTHYRNIPAHVAKLNLNRIAVDIAKTYNELIGKSEEIGEALPEKITMSYNMAKNLGLNHNEIEDHYELTGRRPSNNSSRGGSSNRGGYNGNSRGNSRSHSWNDRGGERSDRGGFRGNDRGGFRNNDRTDRSRNNDRNTRGNDRGSRW